MDWIEGTKLDAGQVVWHTSDDDGGLPDVGYTIGLPDGSSIYFGELSNRSLEEYEMVPDEVISRCSWHIVHYPLEGSPRLLGGVASVVSETDAIELLATAMKG